LRRALLARRELFVATATEKLLTYALGRTVEYYDMPAVRAIARDAAGDDYKLSSLVVGVVRSVPFRMRSKAPPAHAREASAMRPADTRQASAR
jgi:hypothetical protein